MAQADVGKSVEIEKLERCARMQRLRDNPPPNLSWPIPTEEQVEGGLTVPGRSAGMVSENVRNRYAALIERETGQLPTLRPEKWSAPITDGEGDEVANLRGLLAAQEIVIDMSDQELRDMAAELKAAARSAIKIVTEALNGQGNGSNHE